VHAAFQTKGFEPDQMLMSNPTTLLCTWTTAVVEFLFAHVETKEWELVETTDTIAVHHLIMHMCNFVMTIDPVDTVTQDVIAMKFKQALNKTIQWFFDGNGIALAGVGMLSTSTVALLQYVKDKEQALCFVLLAMEDKADTVHTKDLAVDVVAWTTKMGTRAANIVATARAIAQLAKLRQRTQAATTMATDIPNHWVIAFYGPSEQTRSPHSTIVFGKVGRFSIGARLHMEPSGEPHRQSAKRIRTVAQANWCVGR
jgi:hypothetical protein